ncbi:MAG: sulfurtransferase-like selenium metabolism protein YedF [Desulfuromonas sp.]|nr:sulfurtransferase-like selenium metabolism protein YedF [Desulfuromonas sp.]
MNTIDCRGLLCPRPVLETRKQLQAHPDSELTVMVSNDIAQTNVSRLAAKEGFSVQATTSGSDITLLLTPMAKTAPTAEEATPTAQISGDTILYIASNCMGKGSDELGDVLMRNFIFTLAQCQERPSTILFVNSGVKLTCAGSAVLEPLQLLADAGVTICSCGLCLEFFGLQEQLQLGQVSNMLETVEAMQQAGRIIQP